MYICKLNELPINKSGYIENVKAHDALKRRLLDLGFIKNTKIKPILISPFGDPRAYEVRGTIIAIRKQDAKLIDIIIK